MAGLERMGIGVVAFMSGAVIGAGLGLLFAPQPGVRTRRRLRDAAEDLSRQASTLATDVKQMVDDTIDSGKRVVGLG
ncbi:YtxH domain-containing protein [Candidatus Nitrospira bockiana]